MTTPVEMTVTIKGESQTYKEKFLIYEDVTLKPDDEIVRACMDEARSHTHIEPEDVKVRALLVIR